MNILHFLDSQVDFPNEGQIHEPPHLLRDFTFHFVLEGLVGIF